MRIGILKTDHAPDDLVEAGGDYDGQFRTLLADQGFRFTTWPVIDGMFPDSPDAADGWLITGSKHSVYEDLPWIDPLETFIRTVHAAERPLIGICFGHQIVAQALGGRVENSPSGFTVGVTRYVWNGRPVRLNAWHEDIVTRPPDDARVEGKGGGSENAFLA